MLLELSLAATGGLTRALLEIEEKPTSNLILSPAFAVIGFGILLIWWLASPAEAVIVGYATSDLLNSAHKLITTLAKKEQK